MQRKTFRHRYEVALRKRAFLAHCAERDVTQLAEIADLMGIDKATVTRIVSHGQAPSSVFIAGAIGSLHCCFEDVFQVRRVAPDHQPHEEAPDGRRDHTDDHREPDR